MDKREFTMTADIRREALSIAKGDRVVAAKIEWVGMLNMQMGEELDRCIMKMEETMKELFTKPEVKDEPAT